MDCNYHWCIRRPIVWACRTDCSIKALWLITYQSMTWLLVTKSSTGHSIFTRSYSSSEYSTHIPLKRVDIPFKEKYLCCEKRQSQDYWKTERCNISVRPRVLPYLMHRILTCRKGAQSNQLQYIMHSYAD